MTQPPPPEEQDDASRFRRNLIRVMSVQVIALLVLWLAQRHFTS